MKGIVFDIETRPLPLHEAQEFKPTFEPPEHYVKPEAIAKDLLKKEEKWEKKLGLSPLTATICAVGIWTPDDGFSYMTDRDASEYEMAEWFWDVATENIQEKMIGFNSNGFDLPFLARRAWLHGITPGLSSKGFKYDTRFEDLMVTWQAGDSKTYINLDTLARFLNVGEKSGSGEFFYMLLDEDPKRAIRYLQNDVNLTRLCAQRMLGKAVILEDAE